MLLPGKNLILRSLQMTGVFLAGMSLEVNSYAICLH